MRTFRFLLPLVAASSLFITGCTGVSPATVKGIAQGAVSFTVSTATAGGKNAEAVPYLRASEAVVCSAGEGTNLSPAAVVAALESSTAASSLKTPIGSTIMNAVLGVYTGLYDQWGSKVSNVPLLQAALQGVCEGMAEGLPAASPAVAARRHRAFIR